MTPLVPTVLEHTFALGYAVPMGRFTLAFATQLSVGQSTRIGRSRIAGGEFDGGRLDAHAFALFVSLAYASIAGVQGPGYQPYAGARAVCARAPVLSAPHRLSGAFL